MNKKVNQRDGSSWLDMVVAKMLKEVFSLSDFEDEESQTFGGFSDPSNGFQTHTTVWHGLFTSTVGRC